MIDLSVAAIIAAIAIAYTLVLAIGLGVPIFMVWLVYVRKREK